MDTFNCTQVFVVLVHSAEHIDMFSEVAAACGVSANVEIWQVFPYVAPQIVAFNSVATGLASNREDVVRWYVAKRHESQLIVSISSF